MLLECSTIMLPSNTTAVTQLMDHGVIYLFKSYHRKFKVQSLVTKMEESLSVQQSPKPINLLNAVNSRTYKETLYEIVFGKLDFFRMKIVMTL